MIRVPAVRVPQNVFLFVLAHTTALLCGGCQKPTQEADNNTAAYLVRAEEIDTHLREDVLAKWYPICIDEARGGFRQRLTRDWTPGPPGDRFLVFQARMTWVAAQAIRYDPSLAGEYREYALHGLDFLANAMSDGEFGGLYWMLDPGGRLTWKFGGEKHAYGMAFSVYAGAAVHAATQEPRALDLAVRTFLWLDEHAHDDENGGYFEPLSREGEPLLAPPSGGPTDGISTPYGQKSMNSHIHLLEAFAGLYRIWPDERLRVRLEELLAIVRDRIAAAPGRLVMFFTPDWQAASTHDSVGHDIETAFLLVEAVDALGRPEDAETWRVARSLVDHALDWGWDDENGGFFQGGDCSGPADDKRKLWWTQAEGLNALFVMHERYGGETDGYWRAFVRQWEFIREHMIDAEYGGWYGIVRPEGELMGRSDKAWMWKAAYHTARALMNTAAGLRELAREAGRE